MNFRAKTNFESEFKIFYFCSKFKYLEKNNFFEFSRPKTTREQGSTYVKWFICILFKIQIIWIFMPKINIRIWSCNFNDFWHFLEPFSHSMKRNKSRLFFKLIKFFKNFSRFFPLELFVWWWPINLDRNRGFRKWREISGRAAAGLCHWPRGFRKSGRKLGSLAKKKRKKTFNRSMSTFV